MRKILATIIIALFPTFAWAGDDCTCRYQGNDITEGDTICMSTPSGTQMARCERVLNNTSWKMLGTECPTAQLEQPTIQSIGDMETARNLINKLKG